ncbi:MAG: XdhC family protein, partial [Pedobacter sp.]
MKEINDILNAYKAAEKSGLRTALATVVQLEGSSYRRPGARMLISEDGKLTGAISGGCLEGDAMRKALSAIIQQENKLITYDTNDEDDAKIGVQLGCNGLIHILFEPIKPDTAANPIDILKLIAETRQNAVVVTLFSLENKEQPGTSLIFKKDKFVSRLPDQISQQLYLGAEKALISEQSGFSLYQIE